MSNLIPGLYYVPNYLTKKEIKKIKLSLDKSNNWIKIVPSSSISRRVIHRGYSYSYNRSGIKKLDPIPDYFKNLVSKDRLINAIGIDIFDDMDNDFVEQLIINEYHPGQGIAAHIDHTKYFGPYIICLTVGGGTTIEFTRGNKLKSVYVEEGSLYIMSGDARYKWKHQIQKKKIDKNIARKTRYSLTYRTITDSYK